MLHAELFAVMLRWTQSSSLTGIFLAFKLLSNRRANRATNKANIASTRNVKY